MQLKISLVIFGSISSKGQSGLSLFHYRLADYFYSKGVLKAIYCLDHDSDLPFDGVRVVGLWRKPLFYILVKILRFIKNWKKNFALRLIEEKLFDWYYARNSFFKEPSVIISTKPVNPGILKKCIQAHGKSIVIATVAHPLFIRGVIAEMEKRYEVIDTSSYSQSSRIKRLQETFSLANLIVPRISSNFVYNSYIENGISSEKLIMIKRDNHFLLNTDIFTPNYSLRRKEGLRFVTAGFMNLKKGLPLLLEAWKELEPELNNCELIVVGEVDNVTYEVIGKLGKLNGVIFKGHEPKVQLLYQSSHVFIASSVSDLGPRTVQEAMACGLPVIVTSNCGMAEFVNEGVSGFIYDPFDLESLKRHILFFVNNHMKVEEMGIAARERCLKAHTNDGFFEQLYSSSHDLIKD